MVFKCEHCNACFWDDEKLKKSTKKKKVFGKCCFQGKIKLPLTLEPPKQIRDLLTGTTAECIDFRSNIRAYNNALSYVSFGADTSSSINNNGKSINI